MNKISAEDVTFDDKEWEALIGLDDIFNEQCSKSADTSDIHMHRKDIVKLSMNSLKKSSFINGDRFIYTGRSMMILIGPCPTQRVRYENECEKILRYLSIPDKRIMTIKVNKMKFLFYFLIFISIDS